MKNNFGLAPLKKEGAAVSVDNQYTGNALSDNEEAVWYEASYTRAQYIEMAAALKGISNQLIVDLRRAFKRLGRGGYVGGA